MKKNLIILTLMAIISIVLIPTNAFAESIDLTNYNTKGIEEVFSDEGISYDFSNYKEDGEDKITIYLFRGNGCTYCKKFLNYLSDTLLDTYGDKFKVVSFEVWSDSNNASLMQKVAAFLNDTADGVPYIVIGDKSYVGYAESLNSDIENAITDLYNSDDRYDVFEEMSKEEENVTTSSSNTLSIVICNIIIACCAVAYIVNKNNKNKEELEMQINELETLIKKGLKNK